MSVVVHVGGLERMQARQHEHAEGREQHILRAARNA
jgi:hypothetical protein